MIIFFFFEKNTFVYESLLFMNVSRKILKNFFTVSLHNNHPKIFESSMNIFNASNLKSNFNNYDN